MRPTLFAALMISLSVPSARGAEEDTANSPPGPTPQSAPAPAAPPESSKSAVTPQVPARLIGATTTITEVTTGLPFAARVDTGATTCSIHCEAVEIKDADENPKENIGKSIRFLVKNKEGNSEWVETKIVDHVTVRTSAKEHDRYKVNLKLRWEDIEKKVSVTLNDRQHMKYPLLLGRNFLRDDFLVNVSLDANAADED
jgi:hypothetical protein